MSKIVIIFTIFFYHCCVTNGNEEAKKIPSISTLTGNQPEKLEQDCAVTPQQERSAIAPRNYRWKNARVPYRIGRSFPSDQKDNIEEAMRLISNVTCVKFRKRTHERNYVFIHYGGVGEGCLGPVGMQGNRQVIFLSKGEPGYYDCAQRVHTIVHEIMHALGCYHEMMRPDRDNYVTIVRDNIQKGMERNFDMPDEMQETFGIPFDYKSIMMYKWNSFAIDSNKPTIIAKDPSVGKDFRGHEMTKNDIALINAMYECDKQQ